MSSGEGRTVSNRDIQVVQNLIEQCIQLHMNRAEVVNTLLLQAKIEPGFTELVWQKLEEENREFFEAYNIRLALKHHIVTFNELLKKQVELMNQFQSAGMSSLEVPNGSMSQYHQDSGCFTEGTGESMKPESLHAAVAPALPHQFTNGVSTMHGNLQTTSDLSSLCGRFDTMTSDLSAQSSDLRMMQGINGSGRIKPENAYEPDSRFMFESDPHILEMLPTAGESSMASFSNLDSDAQVTGLDDLPFVFGMPRNFSLTDLTAGYSRTDIMESYSRSPFIGSVSDNFHDASGRAVQEENKKLDSVSEGLSYEDFGSE